VAQDETEDCLEYEARIAAGPDVVFAHLTDPARMVQWMGTDATLDPRPGGMCRISFSRGVVMSGRFLEVEPPHRIVFSWGWETELFATPAQSTLVEITLELEGDMTLIRLAHRRLKPGAVAFHRAGWEHYLPRLEQLVATGDPGEDPWRDPDVAAHELREHGVVPGSP
jgi:uncharacterized protein YndB with AHSA1/START domain